MKKVIKVEHYSKLEPLLTEMDDIASDYLSSLECGWNFLKLFDFELVLSTLRSKMPLHFDMLQKCSKMLERTIMRK